jgi:hypothetical protein
MRSSKWLDEEVVELSLLLQTRQLRLLVEAASRRGMSVGQLIRRLTREYVEGLEGEAEVCVSTTLRGTSGVSPGRRRSNRIGSWRCE